MNKLENIVKNNAQKYYTDANQTMSDEVFDAIVNEIRKDNPNSEVLKTGWGYEVVAENKIRHKYGKVGSLEKVRTFDETRKKLDTSKCFTFSAKLDGMSVVLYYKEGRLDLALTRGSNNVGVDITDKVKVIIGDEIKSCFTGAVRGEILMKVEQFNEFKTLHPDAKNHRASAIGLINGDEITDEYKYLTLAVYSVIAVENADTAINTMVDVNVFLNHNFNDVAPFVCPYFDEAEAKKLSKSGFDGYANGLGKEWNNEWNIDGVVISENKLVTGEVEYEKVQNAVAYKFDDEIKITTVKDIEWTMSKNSAYIPVIVFEPIELEGTNVQRATAFNAKFVKENKIGPGAVVAIAKRGQIIPTVMEVVAPAEM